MGQMVWRMAFAFASYLLINRERMKDDLKYQYNYSDLDPILYNFAGREIKAKKILAVLSDYLPEGLDKLNLLDIGSSTGIITYLLSSSFSSAIGIDIDENAVTYSKTHFQSDKLKFLVADSMQLPFQDNTIDVVNCTQVYEHVPDSKILIQEIYRVLKPRGICFFSAGNRIVWMEGHYNLPLLSVMPKFMAHGYMRLMGKGKYYYETHLTYWGLKRLVRKFSIIDYTRTVIQYPEKFTATDMITEGSRKQKLYLFILKIAYWACPNYIWILKKP
jgi:ubiquinone/menaquinone biosynthesis C-methylase UbiE